MNDTINDTIVYHFHFKCWCKINLGPNLIMDPKSIFNGFLLNCDQCCRGN